MISIAGPIFGPVRVFDTEPPAEQLGEIERIETGLDGSLEKLALAMVGAAFKCPPDEPFPIIADCSFAKAVTVVKGAIKTIREWQPPTMATADALREMRLAWGLSRAAFGSIAGVHSVTTWRWESGESKPDVEHVARLRSFALHVGLPWDEDFPQAVE